VRVGFTVVDTKSVHIGLVQGGFIPVLSTIVETTRNHLPRFFRKPALAQPGQTLSERLYLQIASTVSTRS
jgi:hypothetical protein